MLHIAIGGHYENFGNIVQDTLFLSHKLHGEDVSPLSALFSSYTRDLSCHLRPPGGTLLLLQKLDVSNKNKNKKH